MAARNPLLTVEDLRVEFGTSRGNVYAVNGIFNTVLGPLSQNGIDMPPTRAEIDTWESGCKELSATATAWKTMLASDLVDFNSLLTKNNLTPLRTMPTAMAVPSSCSFVLPGGRK